MKFHLNDKLKSGQGLDQLSLFEYSNLVDEWDYVFYFDLKLNSHYFSLMV